MALDLGELSATIDADDTTFSRTIDRAHTKLDGLNRDANGKLRDIRGRFVSEGDAAGKGFRDGIDKEARPALFRLAGAADIVTGAMGKLGSVGGAVGLVSAAGGAVQLTSALIPLLGLLGAAPAALGAAAVAMFTLKLALDGVGEAIGAGIAGDTEKFEAALAELTPAARGVVREVGGAFFGLRDVAQSAFFGPMQSAASGFSATLGGPLRTGVATVAAALGGLSAEVLAFAQQSASVAVLEDLFAGVGAAIDGAKVGVEPLLAGVRDLIGVFVPGMGNAGAAIGDAMARWGAWMSDIASSGQALSWFETAKSTLASLWGIAKNVGSALAGILAAGDGGGLLSTLEAITGELASWVNSAEGQRQIAEVLGLLGDIASDLITILPGVGTVIGGIAAVLTSLPEPVQNVITGILAFAAAWKLLGIQSLIRAAQVAASWLIAMGPVGWIIAAVIALVALIIAYWDEIVVALEAAWTWISELAVTVWTAIVEFFVSIGQSIWSAITTAWQSVVEFLEMIFPYLLAVATGGLSLLVEYVVTHWDQIVAWTTSVWQSIVDFFASCWSWIVSIVDSGVQGVLDFVAYLGSLPGKAAKWFGGLLTAAGEKFGELVSWAKSLPGKVLSALGNIASKLLGAGRDLIGGLLRGMRNAAGDVFGWITGLLRDVKDQVLEFFGIASPSKLFTYYGEMIGAGLAEGLAGSASLVAHTSAQLADAVAVPDPGVMSGATGGAAAPVFRLSDEDRALLTGAIEAGVHIDRIEMRAADNRFDRADLERQISMQVN